MKEWTLPPWCLLYLLNSLTYTSSISAGVGQPSGATHPQPLGTSAGQPSGAALQCPTHARHFHSPLGLHVDSGWAGPRLGTSLPPVLILLRALHSASRTPGPSHRQTLVNCSIWCPHLLLGLMIFFLRHHIFGRVSPDVCLPVAATARHHFCGGLFLSSADPSLNVLPIWQ